MSKVLVSDNKLTAIADAIRGKTGGTEDLSLDGMALAITSLDGGGIEIPTITGNCDHRFNNGWEWFIDAFGDQIETSDINDCTYMFMNNKVESVPFVINLAETSIPLNQMFVNSEIQVFPRIVAQENTTITNFQQMFNWATELRTLPDDYFDSFVPASVHNAVNREVVMTQLFNNAIRLRTAPTSFKQLYGNGIRGTGSAGYRTFMYCRHLDAVPAFPVERSSPSDNENMFSNTFDGCHCLKSMKFDTNQGVPFVVNWFNQTINFTQQGVGFATLYTNLGDENNSRTNADEIVDAETYELNKNNPNSWTTLVEYSRYNRLSAIETINSLPDVSSGSNNTISFTGNAGSATDGGAINTMSAAEIAVATAKGWTVSLI